MATSNVINTLKKRRKNLQNVATSQGSSSNTMEKQISNYKTRLNATGIDAEQATDKRNAVEKALNLKQDQNVLFDILEVLGRPQQALFRGIESTQEGGSFLEGAKEGISGEETTNFGDILRNYGVSDKPLFTDLFGEERSLADILGLAGDIFIDPLDIPLAGVKAVDVAGDAAKGAKALSTIDKAADVATDTAKATKNVLTFAPFQKDSLSALELLTRGTASGVKKGLGVADNLITKGLEKTDAKTLQKMIESGEDVSNFVGKSDLYNMAKKSLKRTKDYGASIPDNIYSTITRTDNALDAANAYGKQVLSDINSNIANIAKETGLSEDALQSYIKVLRDANYKPSQSASSFLVDAIKKGQNTFNGSEAEVSNIKKALESFKEKGFINPVTGKNEKITDDILNVIVGKNGKSLTIKTKGKNASKGLGSLIGNKELMADLDNIKLQRSALQDVKNASKEVRNKVTQDILDARKLYDSNDAFKALYNQADEGYKTYNKMISEATGGKVDFSNMLNPGYTRTASEEEGQKVFDLLKEEGIEGTQQISNINKGAKTIGNKQVFSQKTVSPFADVANEQLRKGIETAKQTRQKQINYLEKQLSSNKIQKAQEGLESTRKQISELSKNYAKNRATLLKSSKNEKYLKSVLDSKIDSVGDIIDSKVIEKAKNVNNPQLISQLLKKSDTYNTKAEKLNNLMAQLNQTGLTDRTAKSLSNKIEKASKSLTNAKADLAIQTEKVLNGAEETFVKNAKTISNQVTKDLTKNLKDQASKSMKIQKLENTKNAMQQGFNDTLVSLQKQQSDYALEYKSLLSKSKDTLEKEDKVILDKIGKLQKEMDILGNTNVQDLISSNFSRGFGDFLDVSTNQAKAINAYNEIFLQSGMNNKNVLKFISPGEAISTKETLGMKRLSDQELGKVKGYLEQMKNFLPKDSSLIKDLENSIGNSKAVYLDKGAYELMSLGNVSEKELNPLLDMINSYNNMFKKYSTLTPGFQLRNITGNASNMYLSGVPLREIPKVYTEANRIAKTDYMVDLLVKNATGNLSKSELEDYKIVKQFIDGGFLGTGKDIRDLGQVIEKASKDADSKNLLKRTLSKLTDLNVKGNEFVDSRNRMALLIYANKNPNYLAKNGFKDAIDAVKQVFFDPKNLSPFEQKYMKKLIPFYTFTKQNLVFQANNLIKNTSKYNRLYKTFNKAYQAVGEDNYRQYQKENFEIPLFSGENGVTTLKANLPVSDLGEYLTNPLQRLVSSTTPLIKTPFEMATGVDTFTGQDISDRSGLETLANALGIQNLTTKQFDRASNIYDTLVNGEDKVNQENLLATLFPSIFRYADSSKIASQQQYEELQQYQELIKELKNQGIDVPTINELTNSTNASIRNLKNSRNKMLKRRSS